MRMTSDQALAFHRALLNTFDTAVMVSNDSGHYVEVNDAACRLLAGRREDIVDRDISAFLPAGVSKADVDVQWRAFLRDGVQSGVFPLKALNGEEILCNFNARANFAPGLHCSFLTLVGPRKEAPAGHLVVCAWSHRVKWEDRWISMEAYLQKAHGVSVSHGISPEVFEQRYGGPDEE